MSDPTYAQASTPTDQPTFRANTLAQLAAPAAPLQPAPVAGWSESAPQRLLVEDFAADMAVESKIRAAIAKTISPQQAVAAGADWVRACIGWFGEDFIPALAATWSIPFQVAPTSAPLTVDGSTTIQIQATDGNIFLCTQTMPVVFNAASSYQGTLTFIARNPGASSTSNASNIQSGKILTGPAGLSIAATPTPLTSGRDIETPQAAITRCLGKWTRLGAGWTRDSFDYLIPSFAPSVTRWLVDDSNPFGPGSIGVYLANANGAVSGPSSDPTTECGKVYAGLTSIGVQPLGTGPIVVQPATTLADTIAANIKDDGSNPNLLANARAAIDALNSLNIIGPWVLESSFVIALLQGATFMPGVGGYDGTITVPTGMTTTKKVPFSTPGFSGGVVDLGSLSCTLPMTPGASVPYANVLVVTPNLTLV